MPNLPVESPPLAPRDKSKPIHLRVTCQPPNPWQPASVSTRWSAKSEPLRAARVFWSSRRHAVSESVDACPGHRRRRRQASPARLGEGACRPDPRLRIAHRQRNRALPHIEHPDEMNDIILDFLGRIDGDVPTSTVRAPLNILLKLRIGSSGGIRCSVQHRRCNLINFAC